MRCSIRDVCALCCIGVGIGVGVCWLGAEGLCGPGTLDGEGLWEGGGTSGDEGRGGGEDGVVISGLF